MLHERPVAMRSLVVEARQPRVVLDRHLGFFAADEPENGGGPVIKQFESAATLQHNLSDTAVERCEKSFFRAYFPVQIHSIGLGHRHGGHGPRWRSIASHRGDLRIGL